MPPRSRRKPPMTPSRERGATAVEYALMAGLIAVVIASAVALFGQSVANLFLMPAGAL